MSESNTSLVLRVCRADLTSQNNFQWPSEVGAVATAPDWKKNEGCGNGLHGWLFGAGDHSCTSYYAEEGAKWLVLEVANDDLVMLGGKVKFPKASVRHIGDRKSATDYLLTNCDRAKADNCIGAFVTVGDEAHASVGALGTATAGNSGTATAGYYGTATAGNSGTATADYSGTATAGNSGTATAGNSGTATAGDYGTATAGNSGTATAGYYGTATAGYYGTATAGNSGTATAGYYGTATAGYCGTATAGNSGTATAGNYGTATAGNSGTATAGYSGTATAGNSGTATAGYYGTATAGNSGTATAGEHGELRIRWRDAKNDRYRTEIAYVGENGIKPNTKYRLDANHKFVEA